MAKDWTDSLRKKMDNYSETPGDEVWKGIAVKTGMAGRRRIPVWIPSLAAAAAVVAGVFLVTRPSAPSAAPEAIAVVPGNVNEYNLLAFNESETVPEILPEEDGRPVATRRISPKTEPAKAMVAARGSQEVLQADTYADETLPQAGQELTGTNTETKPEERQAAGETIDNNEIQSAVWSDWEEAGTASRKKGFTIGVGASGSGKANGSLSRPTALAMGANPLLSNDIGTAWTATAIKDKVGSLTFDQPEVQTEYSHRIPVKIGLTARYYIGRFGIETGLDYSILTSDITTGEKGKTWSSGTQTLQYLGIPLNASFNLLDKRFVTLYLSAGGEMEKCLKGRTRIDEYEDGSYLRSTSNVLKVKPLQWSVNAAAGVQVNILRNLGAYVEPGVVHHFDNGAKVRSSYTDRPTDFSLRFGLRYSFGL